jgi:arylsulfatase A-like enzyme
VIIILYVMDSLRPDFLSCYGYGKETSPHIDGLAREGIRFTHAFAQATWTRPSGAALLSSTYPSVNGVLALDGVLPKSLPWLPVDLRKHGFETVGVSAIGNISVPFGFGRGFNSFIELYKEERVIRKREKIDIEKAGWDKHHFEGEIDWVPIPTSEDINEFIFPFLENHRGGNLFIFAWSLDTHDPYFHRDPGLARFCPPGEVVSYREVKSLQAGDPMDHLKLLYEDMIYYNDHHLGRLVDRLKELNLFEETFFILTGDHGEAFGEHGFNSHGREPYDELIRVPLIMKFPGAQESGCVSDLVQHIDIAPTILDQVCRWPGHPMVQGTSLMPFLYGQGKEGGFAFSEYQLQEASPKYVAFRTHDYKYMEIRPGRWTFHTPLKEIFQRFVWWVAKPWMLFSLKTDPAERVNIVRQEKKLSKSFHARVREICRDNQEKSHTLGRVKVGNQEMDDTVARQLEALGYFDRQNK